MLHRAQEVEHDTVFHFGQVGSQSASLEENKTQEDVLCLRIHCLWKAGMGMDC